MSTTELSADATLVTEIRGWLATLDTVQRGADTAGQGAYAAALGPVTGALGADTPVVADALLGGPLEADLLERSRRLKDLITAGDPDAGLEYFKSSPGDGCTSIIDLARIGAGYDPARGGRDDSLQRFERFATTIVGAPVFEKRLLDRRPVRWRTGSWKESVGRVTALFPGIGGGDLARIRQSVERLSRAAASNPGRVQSGSLFVQNLLYADGKDYTLWLYYAYASFKEIHERKQDPKFETDLVVARAQLVFLVTAWPAYAEAVWNRHVCTIVDWLDSNTTKPGNSPVTLCFDG